MKKNWKISRKMNVVAHNTACAGAIMLMLFVMVIVNMLASSSCSQLMKSIGEKERVLARLEDERTRESARWEEMKTDENLEAALRKHGLAMRCAKPSQTVRMRKGTGELLPAQLSVAKEMQRMRSSMTASYDAPATKTVKPAPQRRRR